MNTNEEKQEIIKSLMPKAVLKAMSSEAINSLQHLNHDRNFISIYEFPFSVGREARTQLINGKLQVLERRRSSNSSPNNDIYLYDPGPKLQISREHFIIEEHNNEFFIIDKQSACGLMIADKHLGGKDKGGKTKLIDGDIIGVGKESTTYFFKFIVM